jgi:hypothetical protein
MGRRARPDRTVLLNESFQGRKKTLIVSGGDIAREATSISGGAAIHATKYYRFNPLEDM